MGMETVPHCRQQPEISVTLAGLALTVQTRLALNSKVYLPLTPPYSHVPGLKACAIMYGLELGPDFTCKEFQNEPV